MPMQTHLLPVPGARLYYEVRGAGPLLLLISGGNGDTRPYRHVAELLASRYTVVTYERRGFSNSPLEGAVDDTRRLADDVEDARRLVQEVGSGPARVFGSSSGAIVALKLLADHGAELDRVIAHEPPLLGVLPDADRWRALFASVLATYAAGEPAKAMQQFASGVGLPAPGPGHEHRMPDPATLANLDFWMRHELVQYPGADIDVDSLAKQASRLVLACGDESRETMPYQPNVVLGDRLHLPVTEFPGGHVGYAMYPERFAERLAATLAHS